MSDTRQGNDIETRRLEIIRTVQTPLGFFVLVVLVVEAIFGVIAGLSSGTDRTWLIAGMMILILLLVALVAIMAIWKPESLKGVRSSHNEMSVPLVSDVAKVSKPNLLCASTSQFETKGFQQDVAILQGLFKRVHVEHNLSSARLRRLLTEKDLK